MIINETMIRTLEQTYRKSFSDDLKRYLLVKYAQEPFPYECSEQDLYTNIRRDIDDYEAGELDVTIKSPSECWQEEREHLKHLYIEKVREVCELQEYVDELEHILSEHGLESSRMVKLRIEF